VYVKYLPEVDHPAQELAEQLFAKSEKNFMGRLCLYFFWASFLGITEESTVG